jgi:sugar phosphate isomerase/epimerase
MLATRTGHFPIGFRQGWQEWQKDFSALAAFGKENEMAQIDMGGPVSDGWKAITDAGIKIVSADLIQWGGLLSPDAGKRKAAVAANEKQIAAAAKFGVKVFFIVMMPEKPDAPRKENFDLVVESVAALVPALEKAGAAMAIEGYPGPGALCCTPETFRALFKAVPSKAVGINYDPSHLIRLEVDHYRFLQEFGERVVHVHGKDAELLSDQLYELGREQPPTFAKPWAFGGPGWRYTLPGHGVAQWSRIFKHLQGIGYKGVVSIELEDDNFNGTTEGEKLGLVSGARFLTGC